MLFTKPLELYINMAAVTVEDREAVLAIIYSRFGDKNTL